MTTIRVGEFWLEMTVRDRTTGATVEVDPAVALKELYNEFARPYLHEKVVDNESKTVHDRVQSGSPRG